MGFITRVKTFVAEKLYFSALNTEFDNIISGTSDGTKDINVAAATVNGAFSAKGAVTLGDAASDTITFTGNAAASNLAINVMTMNVAEIAAGNVTANFTGNVTGDVTGNTAGVHTGNVVATQANITTANIGTLIASTIGAATANIAAAARTRAVTTNGSDPGAGGVSISTSCGVYTTNSSTMANVTNLAVTITTSGRPVFVQLISNATTDSGYVGSDSVTATTAASIRFRRDSTTIATFIVAATATGASACATQVPCSSLTHIDAVAAGTYTYYVQARAQVGETNLTQCKLTAFEI